MTVLYISGPMTGYNDFNRPAFRAAAKALTSAGFSIRSPLETVAYEANGDLRPYYVLIRDDLRILLETEAVAVLPGWEHSTGARLEIQLAESLGMTVLPLDTWLTSARPLSFIDNGYQPVTAYDGEPVCPACFSGYPAPSTLLQYLSLTPYVIATQICGVCDRWLNAKGA